MSLGHKMHVNTLIMPLANTEYKYEFPNDIERFRIQLRDASNTLHIATKTGKVGVNYLITTSGLAVGTTKPNVANDACTVSIAGTRASIGAVAAGTALSGSNVPQDKFGAWAIDVTVGDAKSITPAADNATGYDTAALAIAGIPAVAKDKARLGVVTAISDTGVFNPGTTDLDAATVIDTYTDADLKDETDYPYMTQFAGGVLNEEGIYEMGNINANSGAERTLYFSVLDNNQFLEIMYWTGRRREH